MAGSCGFVAYDRVVLGFVAWFVWRCPTSGLVDRYRQHIRERHLDVGAASLDHDANTMT